MQLFYSWLDVWTHFNLLESEALVDKATVHKLVTHRPHVFLSDWMHVGILFRKLSELLRPQAQLLWNSSERHLSFLLLDVTRRINARNDSDPDFVVLESFDQADVLVVSTTLFNTNPLQGSNVIVLCLIVLVNRSHLLSGQQDELTEDKVQVGASLLDVRLFERFHEDVAFS